MPFNWAIVTAKSGFAATQIQGGAFDGYQLPCVPKIVEEAKRMHVKLPHLRYISWDFTVDSEERIVLIEANLFGQSVWFPQIVSGKGLFDEMDE